MGEKTVILELPVALTDDEFTLRSQALAEAQLSINRVSEELAVVKKEYSETLKHLRGTLDLLAEIVNQRQEVRQVKCTVVLDVERKLVVHMRQDSDEIVGHRAMTTQEMQVMIWEQDDYRVADGSLKSMVTRYLKAADKGEEVPT